MLPVPEDFHAVPIIDFIIIARVLVVVIVFLAATAAISHVRFMERYFRSSARACATPEIHVGFVGMHRVGVVVSVVWP